MRILVVEDEASLAKQLTSSIAEAGYAVDHTADGERVKAEQYLRKSGYSDFHRPITLTTPFSD